MINEFRGTTRWLSNFEYVDIEYEGVVYPTTENAYQASKTHSKRIKQVFTKITPREAQELGQNILMREDWEDVKLKVMEDITAIKFSIIPYKTKLRLTGNEELVEGNHWGDTFWGVCDGKGENNLGKILMRVRESYR